MTEDIVGRIAACDPADLLPERRASEAERIVAPLRPVTSADLGGGVAYVLIEDERGVRYGVPLARTDRLVRARPGDGAAEALVALVAAGDHRGARLDVTDLGAVAVTGERGIDVDQTNELVVVGERAVVKWFLHPEGGEQPALRRLSTLASAGFTGTPRMWGYVQVVVDDDCYLVASVVEYVPGAEDGWDWAVADVREMALGQRPMSVSAASDVGRLVGNLHAALASAGVGHAAPADAASWLDRASADADAAGLGADLAASVASRLRPIGECAGTPTIDVHGDLHIGQVLRTGDPSRYLVIDFDGNPTQPESERTAQQPAARDVAAMLASLDHVGRVVIRRTEGLDEPARDRVLSWIEGAQSAFLAAYRAVLDESGLGELLDDSLLVPLMVQQECREYAYAFRYLPHWRYVPDAALPALLARTEPS